MTWRDALDVPGALSVKECEILAGLAAQTKAERALEVGHLFGRSTVVLLESLPKSCELVTVDHHQGDSLCCATDAADVYATVVPHVDRPFLFFDADMLTADVKGPFGFVFYDADHSREGVSAFWRRYRKMLAPTCTLVYDDADWEEQGSLRDLAEADGFWIMRTEPWFRDATWDKGNPETFTLEVMSR